MLFLILTVFVGAQAAKKPMFDVRQFNLDEVGAYRTDQVRYHTKLNKQNVSLLF